MKRKNKARKTVKHKEIDKEIIKRIKTKKQNRVILGLTLIVIFLIAIKVIQKSESPKEQLQEDAQKLLNAITTNNLIIDSEHINEDGIEQLMKEDYVQLKQELGLKNDFCIYFEDNNGNLIKINDMETGIGSPKVKINGVSCS